MKYLCPYCYKSMPQSVEPSAWGCCGEAGRAIAVPECEKCGAEIMDTTKGECEVCHHDFTASVTP